MRLKVVLFSDLRGFQPTYVCHFTVLSFETRFSFTLPLRSSSPTFSEKVSPNCCSALHIIISSAFMTYCKNEIFVPLVMLLFYYLSFLLCPCTGIANVQLKISSVLSSFACLVIFPISCYVLSCYSFFS